MARKSSLEGPLIVLAIVVAILVKLVTFLIENWLLILGLAGTGFVIWFLLKKDYKETEGLQETSKPTRNTTHHEKDNYPVQFKPSDFGITIKVTNPTESSIQYPYLGTSHPGSKSITTNPESFWRGLGQSIQIAGMTIEGGLLYFGSGLANPEGYMRFEASLIDPKLPIDNIKTADFSYKKVSYWSSYAEYSPTERAAYLAWLVDGKKSPNADIGYVFLYFYGLERRILFDSLNYSAALNEQPVIKEEVSRLLSIYGHHGSFSNYANSLLEYLNFNLDAFDENAEPIVSNVRSWILPFNIKIGLGHFAINSQPLPAIWAYGWLIMDPSIRLRTPATRCPEEFKTLFLNEYSKAYGAGIKLPVNKTKLKLIYRPASPSLVYGRVYEKSTEMPDVSVLTGPVKKLQTIADQCMEKLDAYSRLLGRSPEKVGKLDALLELPVSLWAKERQESLLDLKNTIYQSGIPLSIKFSKLRSLLPEWNDVSKSKFLSLSNRLSEIGLGIEPDPRFDGPIPTDDSTIVIFRDEGSFSKITPRYSAAALTLQLAVAVSSADGGTNDAEKSVLRTQLESWLHLDEPEKSRLRAHLRWLMANEPGLNGIKKKIESIPMASREVLGDFLAEVAHADNEVSAAEVKILERIFKTLELDSKTLYSKLHIASSEPVTIRKSETISSGFTLPKAPKKHESGLNIDMEKVASLHAETEKVSAILGAIFVQDDVQEISVGGLNLEVEVPEKSIMGLDVAHSDLVMILASRLTWSRTELEELAEDRGLMIDGAMEHINDACFDTFNIPFSEGNDPVEINQDVIKEILT